MNNKVVYIWYNIDTNFVIYVGEGTERRAKETKIGRRNKLFIEYINNNNCDYKIIYKNLSKEQSLILETKLLEYYKSIGQAICNLTKNGKPGSAYGKYNPNYHNGEVLKNTYKNNPELKYKTSHYREENGRAKKIRLFYNNNYIDDFNCIADCAEYLIDNNITYPPIKLVSQRIAYHIKKDTDINGYTFKFI